MNNECVIDTNILRADGSIYVAAEGCKVVESDDGLEWSDAEAGHPNELKQRCFYVHKRYIKAVYT